MKNLQTFEEFINKNQIFEAVDFNGERVSLFVGRFQPFHLGHIAAMQKTSNVFQCPVIPIQVLSKTEKSPFPDALLTKIGSSVAKEYSKWMATYILFPSNLKAVIPQRVKYLREQGYESIGMGVGSDRYKAYEHQIKYLNSDKSDVPVSEPFRIEIVDERSPSGPSGTRVRDAIKEGNKKLFEEYTPKSVHSFYDDLKKYL